MKVFLLSGAVSWVALSVFGLFYLVKYENTPSTQTEIYPAVYPIESKLERNSEHSTLLFFSHPKCPCTRASLNELARLIADVNGNLDVYVVFAKPPDAEANWTDTDLRWKAEAIPQVKVIIDENERETKLFKAETSGLVLLYDTDGNLRFSGGITASRGHEGNNAGRQAIFEIVTKDLRENTETEVFGCLLHNKECKGETIDHGTN